MEKNMKKIKNPEAFHKALAQALLEFANEQNDPRGWWIDEFYVDDPVHEGELLTVECRVLFHCELHDESFDHAFGTWRDPNPYFEATGIKDLEIVSVIDENNQAYEGYDANEILKKCN